MKEHIGDVWNGKIPDWKDLVGKRVLWKGVTIWDDRKIHDAVVMAVSPSGKFVCLEEDNGVYTSWHEIDFIKVVEVLKN